MGMFHIFDGDKIDTRVGRQLERAEKREEGTLTWSPLMPIAHPNRILALGHVTDLSFCQFGRRSVCVHYFVKQTSKRQWMLVDEANRTSNHTEEVISRGLRHWWLTGGWSPRPHLQEVSSAPSPGAMKRGIEQKCVVSTLMFQSHEPVRPGEHVKRRPVASARQSWPSGGCSSCALGAGADFLRQCL